MTGSRQETKQQALRLSRNVIRKVLRATLLGGKLLFTTMQWVANEGARGWLWIKCGVVPEGYHSTHLEGTLSALPHRGVSVLMCSLTFGVSATFITALCVCMGWRGCYCYYIPSGKIKWQPHSMSGPRRTGFALFPDTRLAYTCCDRLTHVLVQSFNHIPYENNSSFFRCSTWRDSKIT